jgi:secreted trypsin-like serine protease
MRVSGSRQLTTFALLFALIASLLAAVPAHAITGGQPDAGAHPQVAFIKAPLPPPDTGYLFCSGTLIAPTVVLTAGHCTFDLTDLGFTELLISFDDQITDVSTFYAAHQWFTHPDFAIADWPFTVDIGVVILDSPLDLPLGELPELGVLNEIIPKKGASRQTFTDVGYGQTGVETGGGPPQGAFPLERRQSTQRYHPGGNSNQTGIDHGLDELLFNLKANPSSRHGSGCGGDSGGPIFLGDSYTLVAIHTGGYRLGFDEVLCARLSSTNHRLDTPVVLNWLAQFEGVAVGAKAKAEKHKHDKTKAEKHKHGKAKRQGHR